MYIKTDVSLSNIVYVYHNMLKINAMLENIPQLIKNDYIYDYKYENVCLSVCLYTFFSAIFEPIGIHFGTKLLFCSW